MNLYRIQQYYLAESAFIYKVEIEDFIDSHQMANNYIILTIL